MNSYIHLHKFHGCWVNPFLDQIVPHVCTMLLLCKKKKIKENNKCNSNLYFLSFRIKIFSQDLWIESFMTLRLKRCCSKKNHTCGSLLTASSIVPGLDIPSLHLSCYTVTIMPGEWTLSPVAMRRDQIKPMWNKPSAETVQEALLENAIFCDATYVQQTEAWVPIWSRFHSLS